MRLKPCDVAKEKGVKNKTRLSICMIANVMMMMYNEISHETFYLLYFCEDDIEKNY